MRLSVCSLIILSSVVTFVPAFSPQKQVVIKHANHDSLFRLYNSDDNSNAVTQSEQTLQQQRRADTTEGDYLNKEMKDGYTIKQRLREEVESPFRKVRLVFFASSAGSALTALYFSGLNTIKGLVGGFPDAPPLQESLINDGINIGGAIVCGYLAYRDYQAGQANLERIARGGKLASLVVEPADEVITNNRVRLGDFRRKSRVLIAAGGKEYIRNLALSLTADQLDDSNILPEKLVETDVLVVPVLLEGKDSKTVADTSSFWKSVETNNPEQDRNFDINRANAIIAFPRGNGYWADYLSSEIDTACKQGFDVSVKGITLTVKKNGRILRRTTGLPRWGDLISTMEVMDGSRFGMPGDSERYGGP